MVVARFTVELPEFESIFDRVPGLTIRLVEIRGPAPRHAIVWVSGADANTLADVLETDPNVVEWRELDRTDEECLYRVGFGGGAVCMGLYAALVDLDGAIMDATASDGTWNLELFFPTREAISAFYDRTQDLGLSPTLQSLTGKHVGPDTKSFGLTEAQRTTLTEAARLGYFAVPKKVSLVELADELGISDQAASERLRRGMETLVESTLVEEDGEVVTPNGGHG